MMKAIQQDVELWEVWIEFDQSHPEYFGTLYVHGEVETNKGASSSLTRMDDKERCQLNLKLPSTLSGPCNTKKVVYSEPIRNLNEYTSICIYAGNELIGRFNDIEIMI